MKTIIAGGRDVTEWHHLMEALESYRNDITEVVSGGAQGADALGERYAREAGLPLKRFPADWAKNGKAAGPIRNREMAAYAQALIALWDGKSRGTANMIEEARARSLNVHIHLIS
jgi:hypothetical protein